MTEPRLGRWRAPGQRNNPRSNTAGHLRRPARTREIGQPVDPEPLVSVHPLVHRRLRRTRHSNNVGNGEPVSPPQHDLRTGGNRTVVTILAGQRIQRRPLRFRQLHTAIISQRAGKFNYETLALLGAVKLTYTSLEALDFGNGGQVYGTMVGSIAGDRLSGA